MTSAKDGPSSARTDVPSTPRVVDEVRIGPPGPARTWGVVFGVIWVVAISTFFVTALRDGATAPLFILPVMLVLGLVITWRNSVLGLRSDGDTLTVRGPYSTRRVRRGEISDVRRGEQTSPIRSPAVVVTTTDGAMLIGPPTTLLPFGRRSRDQVDEQVQQVQRWLQAG